MAAPRTDEIISDRLTEQWREGADRGLLLVQRCADCSQFQWYPREHCAKCFSDRIEWVESSGVGILHTFSVVRRTSDEHFRNELPYVIGIVELEEGPRISARIAATDTASVRCGLRVQLVLPFGSAFPVTFTLAAQEAFPS
jgi:uncharacterized protein